MRAITLRMTDELHKELKMRMVMEEKTMQNHIIELISKDLESKKKTK
ncbi:MAG: hypothetical protein ACRCWM_09335 [Sarcina sp.]